MIRRPISSGHRDPKRIAPTRRQALRLALTLAADGATVAAVYNTNRQTAEHFAEQAFADVFAAVLTGENPDGGNWQAPGAYMEAGSARALPPQPDIARILRLDLHRYRVLVVPGFFSACASTGVMPARHGVTASRSSAGA